MTIELWVLTVSFLGVSSVSFYIPMRSTSNDESDHLDPVLQQFCHWESDALIIGCLTPENEEPGTHEYDFATTHELINADHQSIQSPYNSVSVAQTYSMKS